jgi:capsular polysaccharide biosynthesis protein
MYKSNATLLFINPGASTSSQDATLLNNYVQLFESRRVLGPVISEQKLGVTYDQFKPSVAAVNEKGTEVIKLSISTDSSEKSQRFLKAAVESFKNEAKSLYGADKLQVVDNASNAEPAYNVRKPVQLAIATATGLVLSFIVLFFIFDAKGGEVDKKITQPVVKKPIVKVIKPAKQKKPHHTKRIKLRDYAIIRGIKQYFTEYKEDLMVSPAVQENTFDDALRPEADSTLQVTTTKQTN